MPLACLIRPISLKVTESDPMFVIANLRIVVKTPFSILQLQVLAMLKLGVVDNGDSRVVSVSVGAVDPDPKAQP